MVEAERKDEEISLFALGTRLLENRWRIAAWMVTGAVIGILSVANKPILYTASAAFVPQGQGDASAGGLARFAGEFGVTLSGTGQAQSPEFYSMLLHSRTVLTEIANASLTVPELGGRQIPVFELLEVGPGSAAAREEQAVRALRGMIRPSVTRSTGLVQVTVATRWPSVSLAIATRLVQGVNDFNQRTRQGQAVSERKFVEGRLAIAASNLRAAENRLQTFMSTNREFDRSPQLTFQRDRLQRDLMFQQQLFTSLTQGLEEARIREVRDMPVISVVEAPFVSAIPEGKGRRSRAMLGLFLGAVVGVLVTLLTAVMSHYTRETDPAAREFFRALGGLKREVLWPVRWLRRASP